MFRFRRLLWIPILVLTLITVLSIIRAYPRELTGWMSSELSLRETTDRNKKLKEYVNEAGEVTFASDKGYAVSVRVLDDKNRTVSEEYLDNNGNPVMLSAGYSKIARSYDDSKHNAEIKYLDVDGKPVMNTSGYSRIHRTYNDAGKADTDTYYDLSDNPIKRSGGFYGIRREYDNKKKVSAIWYLDEAGNPTITAYGYACARREYDEEGNLKKIMYFDEDGNPVRTRSSENGILYTDGEKTFLDEEGNPVFRLDKVLHASPLAVIVLGLVLVLAILLLPKRLRTIVLVSYVGFILYMTLWYRDISDSRAYANTFWSYRRFFSNPALRQEILNNIWLFVPLGALIYKPGTKYWMIIILVSVGIETVQYLTGTGLCEFDDIMSNTLGGFIGWFAAAGLQRNRQKRGEHHGNT